jgi:SAM-dependent methyltransferase
LATYRRWVIEAWAVYVAIQAGLFESLKTPRTLAALAAEENYDSSALHSLLGALLACGHLSVDGDGTYSLNDSAWRYFLPESDSFIGNSLAFLKTTANYEKYPQILRDGGSVGLTSEQWAYVTRGSASYTRSAVETLIRCCPALSEGKSVRLLDVGCGQGSYLLELGRALPSMEALGIDPTPSVATQARMNVASLGSRVRVEEGGIAKVSETFDLVLINQILHVIGRQESLALLGQARERLVDGGYIFIQEIVSREGDPGTALFGFNMRMLFTNGMVFDLDDLLRVVADAGFVDIQTHPIPGLTQGLVYVAARAA